MSDRPQTVRRVTRRIGYWGAVGLRPYIARRISRELASPRDLQTWVQFTFDFQVAIGLAPLMIGFSFAPLQRPKEILRLVRMVAAERPHRVLEVGSAGGGTLFLWARAAAPDALLVGVDLPPAKNGGLSDLRAALYEDAFGVPPQRIRMVRGDSHDEATAAAVRMILEERPVDFLFIDGDHSYEGVRRDFELYGPLVRPGGLIAFHDIVPDFLHRHGTRTSANTGDVPRFWVELKERYRDNHEVLEFVEDPAQDGLGIGVVRA